MAETETRPSTDVRPWSVQKLEATKLSAVDFTVRYESATDSVFVFFVDPSRPTIGLVLDNNITALIDPATDELLGFEVDHFVAEVVPAHPNFEPMLDYLDMPFHPVRWVRKQIRRTDPRRTFRPLLDQIWPTLQASGANIGAVYR